jgi:hypothetical protein
MGERNKEQIIAALRVAVYIYMYGICKCASSRGLKKFPNIKIFKFSRLHCGSLAIMFFLSSLLALIVLVTASPAPISLAPSSYSFHPRGIGSSLVPLPPSQDPFYTTPAGYELVAPGTILRIHPAPGNLTGIIGNCSPIYNILYRTTDSRYRASWAVTTLFVPASGSYASIVFGSALLSYQIPYNSIDIDASPSYALYNESSSYSDIPAALGAVGSSVFLISKVPEHPS